ncbi:MAG: hypothetical protein WBZ04_04730, partial [Candidatus Nanopelagicales bacterium]
PAYGGDGGFGDNTFGQAGSGGGGFGGGGGGGASDSGGGAGGSIGTAGAIYASSGLSPSANGSIELTYTASASDGAQLVVNTTTKKTLPRTGTTTVVKSAKITPSSAGSLKSITVSCKSTSNRAATRGDVQYCSYTKSLKTGKVKVTTYGSKTIKVKVKIVTKPAAAGGEVLRWTKSWSVK